MSLSVDAAAVAMRRKGGNPTEEYENEWRVSRIAFLVTSTKYTFYVIYYRYPQNKF